MELVGFLFIFCYNRVEKHMCCFQHNVPKISVELFSLKEIRLDYDRCEFGK